MADKKPKGERPIDFLVVFIVGGITISPIITYAYLATFNDTPPVELIKDFGILAPISITGLLGYIGGKAVGRAEAKRDEDGKGTS